jgi:hypothetical protein
MDPVLQEINKTLVINGTWQSVTESPPLTANVVNDLFQAINKILVNKIAPSTSQYMILFTLKLLFIWLTSDVAEYNPTTGNNITFSRESIQALAYHEFGLMVICTVCAFTEFHFTPMNAVSSIRSIISKIAKHIKHSDSNLQRKIVHISGNPSEANDLFKSHVWQSLSRALSLSEQKTVHLLLPAIFLGTLWTKEHWMTRLWTPEERISVYLHFHVKNIPSLRNCLSFDDILLMASYILNTAKAWSKMRIITKLEISELLTHDTLKPIMKALAEATTELQVLTV